MTAYVIVELEPKNPEKMAEYSALAAPLVAAYGGEFIAKGPAEILTGELGKPVKVLISFPSKEKAKAWYNSDDYQAIVPTRDAGMDSNFTLIG
ncbi:MULTISPECIES: DUF1330 domain-containing protein [Kordiimonas]|uniref:DUF1330 domain-containing protein n=1 Tax=Kordiimonas TaxID=288021 RepID=UPI001FF1416E|nr:MULTISPECIES: DUF1330 domain-containing protein [Kordiimonas]MCK0070922.1 DUF1330 domain-containing protein [Kordiimonas laminariae]UTW57791.1 DUF1330 domain-containing protein [Kordiimonas sp. SCSIO 12603]